jgi:hypothetical protein
MNFWRSSGEATPAVVAAPAQPAAEEEYELSAIDLYLTYGHRRGWVATNGKRTSDWLNAIDPLPVRGVTETESEDQDGTPPSLDPNGSDVTSITADDILFVIPPPLPPNRHLRLHRRRVHVDVSIGDVTIGGQAHIRPGAEVGEHIFRGRRFVPLTDVEVLLGGDSPAWLLPVVIINGSAVREIRGIQEKQASEGTAPAAPASAVPTPAVPTPAVPTPAVPAPAPVASAEPPSPPAPEVEMLTSRNTILLTALELLLAEGVIDIVEFQTKRAGLATK